ncbi:unnamed protein product, partial [Pylaiella littoralis]
VLNLAANSACVQCIVPDVSSLGATAVPSLDTQIDRPANKLRSLDLFVEQIAVGSTSMCVTPITKIVLVWVSSSIFVQPFVRGNAGCSLFNWCNGHGTCNTGTRTCTCFEGWGADTDLTLYRAADCSARVCPAGKAWGDVPSGSLNAHQEQECSSRGICNRESGECECFDGFSGAACERSGCPDDCSDHGRCVNMKALAVTSDALPLSNNSLCSSWREDDSVTWDEEMIYGCVCDSAWEVGLGAGQTQEPEWFGPDCSLRHCPSGDDPNTDVDETDCFNVTSSSVYSGAAAS